MKTTIRINDLIDQHGKNFTDCSGCELCDEIKMLGQKIGGIGMDKVAEVNLSKRLEEFKAAQADYPDYSMTKIATEVLNMKPGTLHANVKQWKKQGLLDTASKPKKKETYESVKKKVAEKIKGDPDLIKKLEGRIVELEDQVKGYPALQKRAAKLEIENMKLENFLETETLASHYKDKELEKATEKIEDLKDKLEGSYIESSKWEDQARLYARENDLMNGTNKDLREICEQLRRERNASVELLKVTL